MRQIADVTILLPLESINARVWKDDRTGSYIVHVGEKESYYYGGGQDWTLGGILDDLQPEGAQ